MSLVPECVAMSGTGRSEGMDRGPKQKGATTRAQTGGTPRRGMASDGLHLKG